MCHRQSRGNTSAAPRHTSTTSNTPIRQTHSQNRSRRGWPCSGSNAGCSHCTTHTRKYMSQHRGTPTPRAERRRTTSACRSCRCSCRGSRSKTCSSRRACRARPPGRRCGCGAARAITAVLPRYSHCRDGATTCRRRTPPQRRARRPLRHGTCSRELPAGQQFCGDCCQTRLCVRRTAHPHVESAAL